MKITLKDLEIAEKRIELESPKQVVSAVVVEKAIPVTPFTREEVNFRNASEIDIYPSKELMHVAEKGWQLTKLLGDAIKRRNAGERVLSYREADIVARAKFDISDGSALSYGLMEMGLLLTEGVPGHAESGYELRRRYNTGIAWIKDRRGKVLDGLLEKGIERLAEIRMSLKAIGLDLWEHEVDAGFHHDLTRPEWMSHTQYNKCKFREVRIVKASLDDVSK